MLLRLAGRACTRACAVLLATARVAMRHKALLGVTPRAYAGGCDNLVKMWNLQTNQQQQIAQHAAPVRHCFFVKDMNMLVTGSWDKTLKYWDLRSPNPVHTQNLPERVYAMDVVNKLLVVGTADRNIQVREGMGRMPGNICSALEEGLYFTATLAAAWHCDLTIRSSGSAC